MVRILLCIVVAVAVVGAWACGGECPLATCSSILILEPSTERTLPEGEYFIGGTSDAQPYSCTWTLRRGDGGEVHCDRDWIHLQTFVNAEGDVGLQAISLHRSPERLTLAFRRGAEVLANGDFRPRYEESAPNGRECGPICKRASVTLEYLE